MSPTSRPLRTALLACALALGASGGCAGSTAQTPTVASVNVEPVAELHVGDSGPLQFLLHEVTTEAAIPSGSVLLVVNNGHVDHRIQAGSTFDTGTLRPGDETSVVLTKEGPLTLVDTTTGREVDLTVSPSG